MRHVSRTHHVDLDCLFDRINLDHATAIKCVNTTQQIADVLTKGSFTRERWTQLLQLLHMFAATCTSHLLVFLRGGMSKRQGDVSSPMPLSSKAKPLRCVVALKGNDECGKVSVIIHHKIQVPQISGSKKDLVKTRRSMRPAGGNLQQG